MKDQPAFYGKYFYRRVRSTREGNVFTLSIHRRGTPVSGRSLLQKVPPSPVQSPAREVPWPRLGYPLPERRASDATLRAVRLLRSGRRTFLLTI